MKDSHVNIRICLVTHQTLHRVLLLLYRLLILNTIFSNVLRILFFLVLLFLLDLLRGVLAPVQLDGQLLAEQQLLLRPDVPSLCRKLYKSQL